MPVPACPCALMHACSCLPLRSHACLFLPAPALSCMHAPACPCALMHACSCLPLRSHACLFLPAPALSRMPVPACPCALMHACSCAHNTVLDATVTLFCYPASATLRLLLLCLDCLLCLLPDLAATGFASISTWWPGRWQAAACAWPVTCVSGLWLAGRVWPIWNGCMACLGGLVTQNECGGVAGD